MDSLLGDGKEGTGKEPSDEKEGAPSDEENSKVKFADSQKQSEEQNDTTRQKNSATPGENRGTSNVGMGTKDSSNDNSSKSKGKNNRKANKKIGKRRLKLSRSVHRGLANYRSGMVKRYKRNKKLKGGLLRRGARLVGGAALGTTMAVGAGMIGIASGDPSKAAQYMGAGLAGGYALGKAGVNKTADKLKEQYKEPLKEAKIGYYGEEEYKRREHEKFKKREFEENSQNIAKVQDTFGVSWKEAKEITKNMGDHTGTQTGVSSFKESLAIEKMIRKDGKTKEQAYASAYYYNNILDKQNVDQIKRTDMEQYKTDFTERMMKKKGISKKDAEKQYRDLIDGVKKYTKYTN